ncbi:MAG: hypothetical protein AUG88_00375 [Actinobacteria bacterium 13_1_20CM_4_68_12]|nr:MAG: hypothetical protein AUG88_00375 [Actinobacteria bacterium 13_1_20CM_4_68_12]
MFGGDCFCTVEHMRIPRPRPWDVLFALAGAAALVAEGIHRGTGPVAVAIPLALLACLPLAWSSQAPLTAGEVRFAMLITYMIEPRSSCSRSRSSTWRGSAIGAAH